MLSQDIEGLAAVFRTVISGEFKLTKKGEDAFAAGLDKAAEQARALEGARVSLRQQFHETSFGNNVLRFPADATPTAIDGDRHG